MFTPDGVEPGLRCRFSVLLLQQLQCRLDQNNGALAVTLADWQACLGERWVPPLIAVENGGITLVGM